MEKTDHRPANKTKKQALSDLLTKPAGPRNMLGKLRLAFTKPPARKRTKTKARRRRARR